jgi:hypothetical protein
VTPPSPPIAPTYIRYLLSFGTDAGWVFFDGANSTAATQAQINAVLAGAESFTIRSEYWSSFTPDTTLLDNVVVAGPGVGVALTRSVVAPGEVVELRLFSNPPLGPVDLYVVVALPQSVNVGCGGAIPLVFITNGGSALTLSCSTSPPNTYPRFLASTFLSASSTVVGVTWPAEAPPGVYTFAAAATPPGALADGVIGPGDLTAIESAQVTRF